MNYIRDIDIIWRQKNTAWKFKNDSNIFYRQCGPNELTCLLVINKNNFHIAHGFVLIVLITQHATFNNNIDDDNIISTFHQQSDSKMQGESMMDMLFAYKTSEVICLQLSEMSKIRHYANRKLRNNSLTWDFWICVIWLLDCNKSDWIGRLK